MVKAAGFRVILTTNCDDLETIYSLDPVVDCFNFSYYGQVMPDAERFKHADCTISAIISQDQLATKAGLDTFIDRFRGQYHLKFSTLTNCNEYTSRVCKVDYLDALEGERLTLFDEIEGILYRGTIIKRYDKLLNPAAKQSLKCHVDGTLKYEW
jgi:hypothetical protein